MFLSRAFASEIPKLQATAEMLLWSMVHCHSKGFIVLHGFTRFQGSYCSCAFDSCSNMFKPIPLISDVFIVSRRLNTSKTVATCFAVRDFCKPQGKECEMLTIHLHRGINVRLFESFESLISGRVSPRCWPTTDKYRNVSNLPVSHPVWCLVWCQMMPTRFANCC